jgi:hypothetical protein
MDVFPGVRESVCVGPCRVRARGRQQRGCGDVERGRDTVQVQLNARETVAPPLVRRGEG